MHLAPEISVIVVSYNTKDMTLECLRSVSEQTQISYELIVVDNASRDGSADAIRSEFPEIVLLPEDRNLGFARANNLAAQYARADMLLLLNPDTVVLDHAIDRLVSFSRNIPEAKIWGGRTLFGDHTLNPTSCWRRMTLWGLFCRVCGLSNTFPNSAALNPEAYGGWERDSIREVDIVTGCFLLVSKADWNRLGGFGEEFFMYGEEADLCLRARSELGAKPHFTPDACIIHYDGASERIRADKMVRLLSAKMTLLNRHFPKWQRPIARLLFQMWPLSRALLLKHLRPTSENTASWLEVWSRREEWKQGFPGKL